jgi:DNA-binding response OmpR family regulator
MNNENKNKKILIMEDEEILGKIISEKLAGEGYQVSLAINGEDGMEKMRVMKPDLVLLDMVMPKKNGHEVLEDIKSDSELKNVPVIVISNSGQQSEIERVVGLGVRDYIIKAQFRPDDVLEKVKKYLNQEYKERTVNPTVTTTDLKNIKILLAEDDQFLSSLVAQRLSKEGYKLFSATDGKQVLKIMEENHIC